MLLRQLTRHARLAWLPPVPPAAACSPLQGLCTFTRQYAAQPSLAEVEQPSEAFTQINSQLTPEAAPLQAPSQSQLNFDDPQTAFASKSNFELLRAASVFSACQVPPLVKYADKLLSTSKDLVGSTVVNTVVRKSFFAHFCAGEDADDIKPTLQNLLQHGVGSILDYAAEDDVTTQGPPASRTQPNESVVARTYDYENEAKCDQHMQVFLRCIDAAAGAANVQGFAAIKVTALGQPKLLDRVSASLVAIHNLFAQFDADHNGIITRDEFAVMYEREFNDSSRERVQQLFNYLDSDHDGVLDYLSWSRNVRLKDIPEIVQRCRTRGPLYATALTQEELELLHNMLHRLDTIADAAAKKNVRLMIDAEHSYFQPAIDHAALELQRKYNRERPIIFNTYQCYLKDSHERLVTNLDRAQREGFRFGAKLVRGAYMVLEREHALQKGYPSPIHDTIQDTHANYNRAVQEVAERVTREGAEFMVASHNQESVEWTVRLMAELGLPPASTGIYFGQLLGMADHLTFVLGHHGYRAYKYVPFGRVDEVMPYLIRRAQENSGLIGGVAHEKRMLLKELWRRLRSGQLRGRPAEQPAVA